MLQKLKAHSIKSAVLRFIVFLLVSGALIYFGAPGILNILKGPKKIEGIDVPNSKGAYVTMTFDHVVFDYAYTTERESGKPESTAKTKSEEYMVITQDENYLMGVLLHKGDFSKYQSHLIKLMDYFWEETPVNPGAITLTGTIIEMDSESKQFFKETMDELGADPSMAAFYLLDINQANGSSLLTSWIAFGIGAVLVLFALFSLVRALTGGYQTSIRKYAAANSSEGGTERLMEKMEESWSSATKIGNAYFCSDFFVYQKGLTTHIYQAKQLLWVYQKTTRTNGVASSFELMLGLDNGKIPSVSMRQKYVKEALTWIENHYTWTALGYSSDLLRLFRNDKPALAQVALSQRGLQQNTATASATPSTSSSNYTGPEL